jgi:hypothetical protein
MTQTSTIIELRARLLAQQHRCTITPFGAGWWIRGPFVDLLVGDLRELRAVDLMPPPVDRIEARSPIEVRPARVPFRGRPR